MARQLVGASVMIAAYPWADLPLADLAAVDDVSTANPLADLLSDPRAELAFMMRALPFDPATDAERPVFFSSAGYATIDDGAGATEGVPDHTIFTGSLVSPYSVKVNLISGGTWQASAIPGFGAVVIANPEGAHEDLLKLRWERRPLVVWVGRKQWIGPSFKTLGRVFAGVFDAITWDTTKITLPIRDLREQFNIDVNPESYLGFGTAVRFRAAGDRVMIPYGAWTRPVDPDSNPILAVEFMLSVAEIRDAILATQGGSAGWVARLHVDASLGLYDRDETNWVRTAPNAIRVGTPTRVGFYADVSGLQIRVDGRTVIRNSTPYAGPVVTEPVTLGGPPL